MKKNEMYFYQLLRDFLNGYLIKRRNFSDKTVRSYRQTLNLLRNYFREEKGISFDKMDFSCFSRRSIYDFLMWLKDARNGSIQTLNLRLSAIKSFLKYCSEEDMELMPVYLDVSICLQRIEKALRRIPDTGTVEVPVLIARHNNTAWQARPLLSDFCLRDRGEDAGTAQSTDQLHHPK